MSSFRIPGTIFRHTIGAGESMLRNKHGEALTALALIAPFVAIYGLVFIYPTVKLFLISFTDAPLIGPGDYVGLKNYTRLLGDDRFNTAFWNTAYFVVLTVLPGTAVAFAIALSVSRLAGRLQSLVLA